MSTDDPTLEPRTIDERLEGLTQTVQIIAAMRDNEKRFATNEKRFGEIMEGLARCCTSPKSTSAVSPNSTAATAKSQPAPSAPPGSLRARTAAPPLRGRASHGANPALR